MKRKINYLKAIIASILFVVSFSLTAQNNMSVNFETSASTDWNFSNANLDLTYGTVFPRSGDSHLNLYYSQTRGGATFSEFNQGVTLSATPETHTHMIYWEACDDLSKGKIIGYFGSTINPGPTTIGAADVYSRKTRTISTDSDAGPTHYPKFKSQSAGECNVFVDDVVIYSSNSSSVDITKPNVAPSAVAENAGVITWTDGSDAGTGLVGVIILRTSNAAAASPLALDQVAYSSSVASLSEIAEWDVIGEVVAGVETFTDADAASGTYRYAIITRDLAYNYSESAVNVEALENTVVLTCQDYANFNTPLSLLATPSLVPGVTVSTVEFYEGANLLATVTEPTAGNYVYEWTPSAEGAYDVTAKVVDSNAGFAISDVTSLMVLPILDNTMKSICLDFEDVNADTCWTLEGAYGFVKTIAALGTARSGDNVLKFSGFTGSTGYHVKDTVNYIVVKPGEYIHSLAHAGNLEAGVAAGTFSSLFSSPTPGSWAALSTTDVSTQVYDASVRSNTTGADMKVYPRVRFKPTTTTNEVYYDDFVLYTDANATMDLVAPVKPTNFIFAPAAKLSMAFDWTEGSDALSGIDMTYILRTAITSAASPVLMAQSAYAVTDVVGDWTVIGTVLAGVTTFTDNDAIVGPSMYAVVHKDLAYNYSDALLSTDGPTGIEKVAIDAFDCYGTKGAIVLSVLPQGEQVTIFSISGAQVYGNTANSTSISVDLAQGIYLVRVSDKVQKVVVQ